MKNIKGKYDEVGKQKFLLTMVNGVKKIIDKKSVAVQDYDFIAQGNSGEKYAFIIKNSIGKQIDKRIDKLVERIENKEINKKVFISTKCSQLISDDICAFGIRRKDVEVYLWEGDCGVIYNEGADKKIAFVVTDKKDRLKEAEIIKEELL